VAIVKEGWVHSNWKKPKGTQKLPKNPEAKNLFEVRGYYLCCKLVLLTINADWGEARWGSVLCDSYAQHVPVPQGGQG
jgi:hypothetical protein